MGTRPTPIQIVETFEGYTDEYIEKVILSYINSPFVLFPAMRLDQDFDHCMSGVTGDSGLIERMKMQKKRWTEMFRSLKERGISTV